MTDVERSAAEDIGVRWKTDDISKETKRKSPSKIQDAEYWVRELDNICPEYNEPWPEGLNRVSELSGSLVANLTD